MVEEAGEKAGLPVDAAGNPTVDPTPNVLGLVEAANLRQDDLREAEKDRVREVEKLRADHEAQILDLRATLIEKGESCSSEIAELRAAHAQQLREAEAQRIDAIREVDVKAVQAAAEVQATAATALAANVQESAEAQRNQVAAAATAAATALGAALQPIIKDIADLRQAQYEAQGQKTQVTETQSRGAAAGLWIGVVAASLFGFLGIVAAVVVAVAV